MLSRVAFCTWLVLGASAAWACGSDNQSPPEPGPAAGKGGSAGNQAAGGSSAGRSSQSGRGGTAPASGGASAAGGDAGMAGEGGSPPSPGSGGKGGVKGSGGSSQHAGGTGGEPGSGGTGMSSSGGDSGGDGGSPDTGCSGDGECPGQRCNTSTHACVACLPDNDNCPTNQYCDGGDFTCKSGCKDNAGCASGLCKSDHSCAECNPSGTDTCATGSYCSSAGACTPGCKADGSGCASGVCLSTHECSSCIADSECTDGQVCSTGTCTPNCGHDEDCGTTGTCCTDRCAEVAHDYKNCLACGNACAADQFCGTSGCVTATLSSVCASATATFLLDGLSVDEATVPSVRDAFIATCSPSTTPVTAPQASAGTINATTGQPVVGSGNLQVVVGGTFGQRLMSYLESSGLTAVFNSYVGTTAQFSVRDDSGTTVVVTAPESVLTDSHSYFVIETVVDPATGTLTLATYGFTSPGTAAAAWYFVNQVLPSVDTFDASYYVFEWTDEDADLAPSAQDTFTLVVSGP